MEETFITSNEKGMDALFEISERVNNFGGRLEVRRLSIEECWVRKIFFFNVPTVNPRITILELESESGVTGYYLPSAEELKPEYKIGESMGDMSIFKSHNVKGVLFSPEMDLGKARKRIVSGRNNATRRMEMKQTVIIAIQLLILFYFHIILK